MPETASITKIKPIGDKVLVRPLVPESKSKGGIFIPDSAKKSPLCGVVIASGDASATVNRPRGQD